MHVTGRTISCQLDVMLYNGRRSLVVQNIGISDPAEIMRENHEQFRILSIDAGGIRGVYTAVLLNRIAQRVPELFDETHFFAGTSTGSILSMGLAFGIPPAELVEIMRAYGQVVLRQNLVRISGRLSAPNMTSSTCASC